MLFCLPLSVARPSHHQIAFSCVFCLFDLFCLDVCCRVCLLWFVVAFVSCCVLFVCGIVSCVYVVVLLLLCCWVAGLRCATLRPSHPDGSSFDGGLRFMCIPNFMSQVASQLVCLCCLCCWFVCCFVSPVWANVCFAAFVLLYVSFAVSGVI